MIEEAIESVLQQNYPHVEHIIVDGGSTDNTLAILKKYPHLKVLSEPDKNLYDGLNKGIRLAKGNIIGHLNSDDRFTPHCFKEIVHAFETAPECDSVCGGALIFETQQKTTTIIQRYESEKLKSLSLDNITMGMPIINARFFRKSVYEKIGLYDIRYKIAADREFLLRAYLALIKTHTINSTIYQYRQHPSSLTFNTIESKLPDLHPEYLDIIRRYHDDLNMPHEIRIACRNWHNWMAGYAVKQSFRQGSVQQAFKMIAKGIKFDIYFLPRYMHQLLKHRKTNGK